MLKQGVNQLVAPRIERLELLKGPLQVGATMFGIPLMEKLPKPIGRGAEVAVRVCREGMEIGCGQRTMMMERQEPAVVALVQNDALAPWLTSGSKPSAQRIAACHPTSYLPNLRSPVAHGWTSLFRLRTKP